MSRCVTCGHQKERDEELIDPVKPPDRIEIFRSIRHGAPTWGLQILRPDLETGTRSVNLSHGSFSELWKAAKVAAGWP